MEAARSGWSVGTSHKEACSSVQHKDGQWLFYEGWDSGERSEVTEDSEEFHSILVQHCDMKRIGRCVEGYLGLQALDREDWADAGQRFDSAIRLGFTRSHTGHALLYAARGQLEDGRKRLRTISNLVADAAWEYASEGVFHQFLSRATDYSQPAPPLTRAAVTGIRLRTKLSCLPAPSRAPRYVANTIVPTNIWVHGPPPPPPSSGVCGFQATETRTWASELAARSRSVAPLVDRFAATDLTIVRFVSRASRSSVATLVASSFAWVDLSSIARVLGWGPRLRRPGGNPLGSIGPVSSSHS